jgi:serine/threonine protein kinase
MTGETLAHYRILQKLGSGGMGEVYEADDSVLNRRVALKVLPPALASDTESRARFTREAKALAALNHPNIVVVYSVERDRGVDFITMELVKGKTLAQRLPAHGLPLDRFFDIAIPLADAVAAAHAQGIVHRDLKPSNVMVTDEGRVKVLDFGLARLSSASSAAPYSKDAPTASMTAPGVVAGTWSYMSPEQARGESVDTRSDLFSLGIVFWEMLTGQRPFVGGTPNDVVSSILKDPIPEVSSVRTGVPRDLSRIVRRCLARDPARRAQSALDVRNELEELRREIDSGVLDAQAPSAGARLWRSRPAILTASFVAGGLTAALVGWLWTRSPSPPLPSLQNARLVTSGAGVETQATWSPDGGRIAFVSDQSGNPDIWVVHSAGGSATNLTGDHQGIDVDPSWSPDGTQIAFASARDGSGIFVMPSIGGPPVRLASRGSSEAIRSPAWSAEGAQLAFLRFEPASASVIEIVSLRTRQSRRIEIPGDQGNRFDLSWSPDGRFFAYVRAPGRTSDSTVWLLRAADGRAFAMTDGTSADWSPIWSNDPGTLFYLSDRGGSMDLWRQRLSADGAADGEPVAVTVGVGMQQAAFSRDGRRLAYSKGQVVSNIWRVPLLKDRAATWLDAAPITSDQANIAGFDLFSDGDRLVISSDRGGKRDLWSVAIRGSRMLQLTDDRSPEFRPRLSPDGQRIAFYAESGNRDVWTMPAEGGPTLQITHHVAPDMAPSWSPDGSQLIFHSGRTDSANAFIVPAAGGRERQVTDSRVPVYVPAWSPDGAWIGYMSRERLWRIPAAGGTEEKLSDIPIPSALSGTFRWSLDGSIYWVGGADDGRDVFALAPAGGVERRVTRLSGREGSFGNGLAVGPAHLYFLWSNSLGDIWVVDVVTGQR